MRTIVIGDVHGCLSELKALLGFLDLAPEDRLVYAGDLVDKGPDSPGVVRFVQEHAAKVGYSITLVKGNHEEKHERFRKALREGRTPKFSKVEELASITEGLSEQDVAFLDSAVLWTAVPGGIVVHAGVPPCMKTLPPLDGATLTRKERDFQQQLLRVRHVSSSGYMLPMGAEKEGDPFWANVYDGRFGVVYFGHQPYKEITHFPHAVGLDTGCVFGYLLSSAVLTEDGGVHFVSVPAEKAWARRMHEDE